MRPRNTPSGSNKVDQNMTPMIDVVFQLLAFFVMTFKVAQPEGDFNVKMPLNAPSAGVSQDPFPPIKLRITAKADGSLNQILMGSRPIASYPALHAEILNLVGSDTGPGSMASQMEVELDCDYALHYDNVIQAITAVSGYVRNDKIFRLIEKVKFASPREAGA